MGVVARIRDPNVVFVRRIDVNRTDEALRIVRGERVNSRVSHAGLVRHIGVVCNKQPTGVRSGPQRAGVAREAFDLRDDRWKTECRIPIAPE